jgi:riboflavin transporter FmnP
VIEALPGAIAAFGAFVAAPLTGSRILDRWLPDRWGIDRAPIAVSIGLAIWSVPMLLALIARAYSPALIGAAGWVVTVVLLWRRPPRFSPRLTPRSMPSPASAVLAVGLAVAAAIYLLFPADPTTTVRDMAVYAIHADYIAEHGRQDVPYAPELADEARLPPGALEFAGVYATRPTMTVQFGHLYPAWLAQVFGVFGFGGVIRANGVVAILSALAVFGVARTLASPMIAALGTVVLAINPSQVWTTHNPLTEIPTQLLVWSALLVMMRARSAHGRVTGFIAGGLIATAAVVRIDSLVLVPLLFVAFAAVRVVDDRSPEARTAVPFWLVAAPIFLVAVAYYAGFTEPYFRHLSPQLRLIGVAAVAGAAILALSFLRRVREPLGTLVRNRAALIGIGLALAAVLVYAYFLRPLIGPFDLIEDETFGLAGTRSQIEEALPNLGLYLSPPVVWVALAGWIAVLLRELHAGRTRFMPLLVVTGGFGALYFWDQSIFPDHFWAVRRFVPIVIPALIIFAGAGLWLVLARVPMRARTIVVALLAVGLGAYTVRIGAVAATTAERAGDYDALETFSEELPAEPTYLGIFDSNGARGLGLPLALAFDRQLIALDAFSPAGREEALRRLAAASPESPVFVITNLVDDAEALVGDELASVDHERGYIANQLRPVPRTVARSGMEIIGVRVTAFEPREARYGGSTSWWVTGTGFHPAERIEGQLASWTQGTAVVRVPLIGAQAVGTIEIELLATGPDGSQLGVTVNGIDVLREDAGPGPWTGKVDVPPGLDATELVVELTSDTFVPAEAVAGSTDERTLGVLVETITWQAPER